MCVYTHKYSSKYIGMCTGLSICGGQRVTSENQAFSIEGSSLLSSWVPAPQAIRFTWAISPASFVFIHTGKLYKVLPPMYLDKLLKASWKPSCHRWNTAWSTREGESQGSQAEHPSDIYLMRRSPKLLIARVCFISLQNSPRIFSELFLMRFRVS